MKEPVAEGSKLFGTACLMRLRVNKRTRRGHQAWRPGGRGRKPLELRSQQEKEGPVISTKITNIPIPDTAQSLLRKGLLASERRGKALEVKLNGSRHNTTVSEIHRVAHRMGRKARTRTMRPGVVVAWLAPAKAAKRR